MQKYNFKDKLLYTLNGTSMDKIPAISVTQTGTTELMDATDASWPLAHVDPEKMANLAYGAYDLTRLESIRYPFCQTVLAEAMGCRVNMGNKTVQPTVESHPYAENHENIEIPENLHENERILTVLTATRILENKAGEDVPLIAGIDGNATLLSQLVGTNNYQSWFIEKPEYVAENLRTTIDACIEYSNALIDNGADVICMSDSIVSPNILNPELFETFIKPEYQRFCKSVKAPKIIHICGDINPILASLSECGFNGINVDENVNLESANRYIRNKPAFIGNISTTETMLHGTYDQVKEEARKCLENKVDALAPGCGIDPKTPFENVKALVRARNEYYLMD